MLMWKSAEQRTVVCQDNPRWLGMCYIVRGVAAEEFWKESGVARGCARQIKVDLAVGSCMDFGAGDCRTKGVGTLLRGEVRVDEPCK